MTSSPQGQTMTHGWRVGTGEIWGEESLTSSGHHIDFFERWLQASPVLSLCTDVSKHQWPHMLWEGEPRHGGADLLPFPLRASSLPRAWDFVLNPSHCFSKSDSGAWGFLPVCQK